MCLGSAVLPLLSWPYASRNRAFLSQAKQICRFKKLFIECVDFSNKRLQRFELAQDQNIDKNDYSTKETGAVEVNHGKTGLRQHFSQLASAEVLVPVFFCRPIARYFCLSDYSERLPHNSQSPDGQLSLPVYSPTRNRTCHIHADCLDLL